eukprot:5418980-Prymnesium_polylepis.2
MGVPRDCCDEPREAGGLSHHRQSGHLLDTAHGRKRCAVELVEGSKGGTIIVHVGEQHRGVARLQ